MARLRIQARIQRYSQGEIRFNLMAIIRDRWHCKMEELAVWQARRSELMIAACAAPSMEDHRMGEINEEISR